MKNIFKKLTGYVLTQYLLFILFPIFSPIQAQTNLSHTSRLNIPITYHTSLVLTKNQELSTKNSIVSDYLSSTKQIIKEDGSIVEQPSYYPYGTFHSYTPGVKEIHTPGVNDNNRYYTGQRKVTNDSPLYNYNARYYNPNLGIFIQPDSVEGPNRYAYVGGNPIMKNDPSGLMSTDPGAGYSNGSSIHNTQDFLNFAKGRDVYTMSPDQGISDTAYHTSIAGIFAIPAGMAAVEFGPSIFLAGFTACMGNISGCRAVIADTIVGEATGGAPVAPIGVIPRRSLL